MLVIFKLKMKFSTHNKSPPQKKMWIVTTFSPMISNPILTYLINPINFGRLC